MKRVCIFILFLLTLVACSNNEEKIKVEVEESHAQVEFVRVHGEEEVDGNLRVLDDLFNFKDGKVQSEIVTNETTCYKDKDRYFTYSTSGYPPLPPDKLGTMRASLDRKESLNQNPFDFFKKYDDSFTENLVMEENDSIYIFSYEPSDEVREEFYEAFILEFLFAAQNENEENDPLEQLQIDLDSFELMFEVDVSSKLITQMFTHEEATLELEGTKLELDRKTTYEFDKYDQPETIEVPEDALEITTIDTYINN